MSRARTPVKLAPAPKTKIHDTGIDPLASFLAGRDGWELTDSARWLHKAKGLEISVSAPGSEHRFSISVKGSKPVTFRGTTAVESFVTTAGA